MHTDTVSTRYDEIARILGCSGNTEETVAGKYGRRKDTYINEMKFNEVKRLHKEGKGISETASLLGIARQTVRKYRAIDTFPVPKGKPKHWYHLHDAARSFIKCIRSGRPVRLDRWLDKYENSIIPRIRTFTKGISMDITAVKNAIIYPVSNGITEG